MPKGLITTAVGSYPKPEYVTKARAQVSRGEMSKEELEKLERKATEHWVRIQEGLDMDILVDGEMYRGDMATYFAENMDGFGISGLVRSYGNRYYRKPVARGPVRRPKPITVEWWKWTQGLTDRPVKGMLTGPYTIADWSFDEHYPNKDAFVMDLAQSLHEEALDLQRAGCKYLQIDEPAASTRPEEMELVSKAMGVVTENLDIVTITHVCYGDFHAVFDQIAGIPVDVLDLEMANSNYDLLEFFRERKPDKILALGVFDVHSHEVESVEEMERGIRKALEIMPPERLWIDPDCGLKTRTEDESLAKMRNMMEAVRRVRRDLDLE